MTSTPPIQIPPSSTSSSPASIRSAVDFPEPDGPTSTISSASAISRSSASTAATSRARVDARRPLEPDVSHDSPPVPTRARVPRRPRPSVRCGSALSPRRRRPGVERRAAPLRRSGGALVACTRIPSPTAASPASIARQQARVARTQQASAEHDLDCLALELEARRSPSARARPPRRPAGRRSRPRPRRAPPPRRRRAPARSSRRCAIRPAWISSASSLGESKPKWAGHSALQASSAARGRPRCARPPTRRLEADVVTAAPVARDRAERGEAHLPTVGRDPDAVDPGAAHDGDAPAALGAGAQDARTCRCRRRRAPAQPRAHDRCAQLAAPPRGSRRPRGGALRPRRPAAPSQPGVARPPRRAAARARRRTRRAPRWCGERADRGRARAARRPRARARGRSSSCRRRRRGRPVAHRAPDARLVVEQALQQRRSTELVLPDQRMARSAFRAVDPIARRPRLGREPLVGRDVLDEPEQLGRERRLRQRLRPVRADRARAAPRRRRPRGPRRRRRSRRRRPARPRRRRERGDQRRRRLAVERAAALLEQRGLLRDLGVAIDVEQPRSISRHRRRTRHARRSCSARTTSWRRSSGGRTTASRRAPRAAAAGARPARELLAVLVRAAPAAPRSPSTSTRRTHVRWLRPTWSTSTRSGAIPSSLAISRWTPIATLQRPIARWPASSSARVTIPTGFVKSTIQASGARELPHALGDLEHDRHSAHRLRKAACARRLLADAAAGERERLVREPRRLPSDPQLEQDEPAPSTAASRSSVTVERAAEALALEHPRRHRADDLAPLRVDVVEDELLDGDPGSLARQPGDELGRVGRAHHRPR